MINRITMWDAKPGEMPWRLLASSLWNLVRQESKDEVGIPARTCDPDSCDHRRFRMRPRWLLHPHQANASSPVHPSIHQSITFPHTNTSLQIKSPFIFLSLLSMSLLGLSSQSSSVKTGVWLLSDFYIRHSLHDNSPKGLGAHLLLPTRHASCTKRWWQGTESTQRTRQDHNRF